MKISVHLGGTFQVREREFVRADIDLTDLDPDNLEHDLNKAKGSFPEAFAAAADLLQGQVSAFINKGAG